MQVSQAGSKAERVRVEEPLLKNQPIKEIKMKKIFMSRLDNSEAAIANPAPSVTPVVEMQTAIEKDFKPVVLSVPQQTVVQPPLPPYPPPESPPLNVTIKQERIDEEEENVNPPEDEGELPQQNAQPPVTKEEQPKKKKTICKEFIRGNCVRPVCKFAHEMDVTQLKGIFTFCWNYQNAVCEFPNCRFVHASVFEEAEFYRTGKLPPHARSHLNKQQAAQPEPEEKHPEIKAASFANPPPQSQINFDQRHNGDFPVMARNASHPKSEWTENNESCTSPQDNNINQQMANKCQNCDVLEFSVNIHKEKIKEAIQSSEEWNNKILQLNKKSNKLFSLLATLLKSAATNKPPVSNGMMTGGEKDKLLLEHLTSYINTNNRLSTVVNEDSLKNLVGGNLNLSGLMVKLFSNVGESTLPADTPRES